MIWLGLLQDETGLDDGSLLALYKSCSDDDASQTTISHQLLRVDLKSGKELHLGAESASQCVAECPANSFPLQDGC